MQIHIFDVEHGSCSIIIAPSKETILIDCGHNSTTSWRPSGWLYQNGLGITNLTITNMDEDHVSDLPQIYEYFKPQSLSKNWHLTPDWVRRAKAKQGMGPGIKTALKIMEAYTGPSLQTSWGGMGVKRFCLPTTKFDDENSLSLVTFINYGGLGIVFPGDLTKAAWEEFLSDPTFCACLKATNIFIASHHGRQDGYCPEVFKYCVPAVIVISDMSVQYDTQLVNYSQHATGILWSDGSTRKVLTTRKHGKMTIEERGGSFNVTTQV